jgi:hypothetical protein
MNRQTKWQHERRDAGLCTICGKHCPDVQTRCPACRTRRNEQRKQARREKAKRKMCIPINVHAGAASDVQKSNA